VPYLHADPGRVRAWEGRLGPRLGPRVGLVWSGGHRADLPTWWDINRRRNVPAALLARIARDDVTFYGLQKRDMLADTAEGDMAAHWPGGTFVDLGDALTDFAETAAILANLDLLITVDTSVAHLAGAMGRPVWILNRFDACWRWLDGRDDSPWYPSARLFRQPAPGDWESVIAAVRAALAGYRR
jgi:hypothetical protein